jgi:hypothetical protein
MTDVRVYADWLRQVNAAVADQMGVNFAGSDKQLRVVARVMIGDFATLLKLLVDKGVLTDQEIQGVLAAAAADTYADEPLTPPQPVEPVPDPEPVPEP